MAAQRYHIIINLNDVPGQKLTGVTVLEKLLNELPAVIDMRVLRPPVVVEGIPQNPGLSGFVIIDYSHVSVHTFALSSQALIDIFSCKPYSQKKAVRAVLKYFLVPRSAAQIQIVSWG